MTYNIASYWSASHTPDITGRYQWTATGRLGSTYSHAATYDEACNAAQAAMRALSPGITAETPQD